MSGLSQTHFFTAVAADPFAMTDSHNLASVAGGAGAVSEDEFSFFASLRDDSLHSLAATSGCGGHDCAAS